MYIKMVYRERVLFSLIMMHQTIDVRVLMSTNILSVDEELIHCVGAICFVNAIKGDRKVIVRFFLRIKYNEFGK